MQTENVKVYQTNEALGSSATELTDAKHIEIEVMEFKKDTSGDSPQEQRNDGGNTMMKYINSATSSMPLKWTRADERTVDIYIKKARGYKAVYNGSYFEYNFYYKLILYPLVVVSCLSIGFNLVSATLANSGYTSDSNVLSIITACISGAAGVLTWLNSKTNYNNISKGCRDAGVAFSDFADELTTLIILPRERRANPYHVISSIQTDYKKMVKMYSKYQIPSSVYRKLEAKHDAGTIILDVMDNVNYDGINIHNKSIEKNMITDVFIDSIQKSHNAQVLNSLKTEVV